MFITLFVVYVYMGTILSSGPHVKQLIDDMYCTQAFEEIQEVNAQVKKDGGISELHGFCIIAPRN